MTELRTVGTLVLRKAGQATDDAKRIPLVIDRHSSHTTAGSASVTGAVYTDHGGEMVVGMHNRDQQWSLFTPELGGEGAAASLRQDLFAPGTQVTLETGDNQLGFVAQTKRSGDRVLPPQTGAGAAMFSAVPHLGAGQVAPMRRVGNQDEMSAAAEAVMGPDLIQRQHGRFTIGALFREPRTGWSQ